MVFGILLGIAALVAAMVVLLWGYLRSEEGAKERRRIPMGAAGWVRGHVRLSTGASGFEVVVNRSGLGHLSGRIGGKIIGAKVDASLENGGLFGRCAAPIQVQVMDGRVTGKIRGEKVELELKPEGITGKLGRTGGIDLQIEEGRLTGTIPGPYGDYLVNLTFAEMPPLAVATCAVAVASHLKALSPGGYY